MGIAVVLEVPKTLSGLYFHSADIMFQVFQTLKRFPAARPGRGRKCGI
jgi:hypothetical protein